MWPSILVSHSAPLWKRLLCDQQYCHLNCSPRTASTSAFAFIAAASTSLTSTSLASSSIAAPVCLAVVVYLGLERGDDWQKGLHLLHYTLMLGGIGHFAELLLQLLFSDGFSTRGCCGVVMRGQLFDDLVDDGGGVCLAMEAKGIGRDGWLTSFDVPLRFFEMGFERRPSLVGFWFAVPLSDVAGKDGRTGDDDESNVDELSRFSLHLDTYRTTSQQRDILCPPPGRCFTWLDLDLCCSFLQRPSAHR
jgi:hypothetical protein